jgi:tetratricopeptide (TPR) repeat protein
MTDSTCIETEFSQATDGNIAVINLESATQRSWSRFWHDPHRPGIAELIVEQEQLAAQFLGDLGALERLEVLTKHLWRVDAESMRSALIGAQVASMAHRFSEARDHLELATLRGATREETCRLSLSIDQACGTELDAVLEARRRMAAASGRLEDQVPLGAVLADRGEFDEADRIYRQALREYQDVSPFAIALVCFQLGVLWGELATEIQPSRATQWYRKAIEYLPCYVKARVHLAEICTSCGRAADAEALLNPVIASGDPEVHWRLADVMTAMGRPAEAQTQMQAARIGFEALLGKHLLAFADHGAEFYSGSGNDAARSFELASLNLTNRPTLRAFEQAYAAAVGAGKTEAAIEMRAAATARRYGLAIFRRSFPDPRAFVGART